MKSLLSLCLIVALMCVVWMPKSAEAKHRSKSYSKSMTKSSGYSSGGYSSRSYSSGYRFSGCPSGGCPNVSSGFRASARVGAAAGHWVWVPDVAAKPAAGPVKFYAGGGTQSSSSKSSSKSKTTIKKN